MAGHAGVVGDGGKFAAVGGIGTEEAVGVFGVRSVVGLAVGIDADVAGAAVLHIGGVLTGGNNGGHVLGVDVGGMEGDVEIDRHALFGGGFGIVAGAAGSRFRSLVVLFVALEAGLVPGVHKAVLALVVLDHGEGLHALDVLAQSGMADSAVAAILLDLGSMSFVVEDRGRHLSFARVLHDDTHDPGFAGRDLDGVCGVTERNDADETGHHCHTARESVSSLVHGESFQ